MTSLDPLRGTPAWGAGEAIPDLFALLPPRFSQPALCAEASPDDWFPDKGGDIRRVEELCKSCPALNECAEWALTHHEPYGVWGAMSPKERKRIRRRRAAA